MYVLKIDHRNCTELRDNEGRASSYLDIYQLAYAVKIRHYSDKSFLKDMSDRIALLVLILANKGLLAGEMEMIETLG